ncbi:MAG: DUF2399 domain-containing protein [Mycobacteriales bacterium]
MSCTLCDDACADADLRPLLQADISWLWAQIADAADRRGDPHMSTGTLDVTPPGDAAARAAALGLIADRPLTSRRKRVDLKALTAQLRHRGPALTPGAVAAHARGGPLAQRSKALAEKQQRESTLRPLIHALTRHAVLNEQVTPDQLWEGLRRTGWLARLHAHPDASALVETADRVLAALPTDGGRVDRRRLAETATGNPHALDEATGLAGLVLATLISAGVIPAGSRTRPAWAAVAVDLDDLTGGLLTLGLRPAGWVLPHDAIITLPPRALRDVQWAAAPPSGGTVFITENPSVIAAAADHVHTEPVFVVCTSGTPAASEIDALSRLGGAGWAVKVRADFDVAGVDHVRALLVGIPGAEPWRMSAAEYARHAREGRATISLLGQVAATPWDARLQDVMHQHGVAVFEESMLTDLLADLGHNGQAPYETGSADGRRLLSPDPAAPLTP